MDAREILEQISNHIPARGHRDPVLLADEARWLLAMAREALAAREVVAICDGEAELLCGDGGDIDGDKRLQEARDESDRLLEDVGGGKA